MAIALEDRGTVWAPTGRAARRAHSTAGLRLWQSGDASIRTGLWECSEGRFRTCFDEGEGEVIWVVDGTLTCIEDGGPTSRLVFGDVMLFPPGWSGEWRIEGTLRKVLAGWTGGTGGAGADLVTRWRRRGSDPRRGRRDDIGGRDPFLRAHRQSARSEIGTGRSGVA